MKHASTQKIPLRRDANPQETLKTLLLDPNPCVASLAMEQMLLDYEACERFIAAYQDGDDLALRKCAHQLAGCLRLQLLQDQFVYRFSQGQLDAWDAAVFIDQMYDQRSSAPFLQKISQSFLTDFQSTGKFTLRKLTQYMTDLKFSVAPHPIVNIYHYLLGDVLENGQGTSVILCILARQLGRSRAFPLHICLHSGKFCVLDHQQNLADPTENWKITKNVSPDLLHICTNQEIIRAYLTQLIASSVMVWEAFDVHLFTQLLLRIEELPSDLLPYPYGNFREPPVDPEP